MLIHIFPSAVKRSDITSSEGIPDELFAVFVTSQSIRVAEGAWAEELRGP